MICLFFTSQAHVGEKINQLSRTSLSSIKGTSFQNDDAVKLIDDYLVFNQENQVDYLYNPNNGELVLYLKDGLQKVEVMDYHITSQITNVDFKVNDKIILHVSYYTDSGKILLTRSKQYSEFWEEYIPVITEL
ncbi:hypothetical protein NH26_20800 [Flammeovirga pacifica]|uniref:Uncharacterized protein n=2 Tax=Flammeovirga pacifica TaxID=915059 RepID=A0A1S1YSP5_FLAPC|nr:hypothetical protein NH26_20800 [Flammeovirga pacifica]